MIERRLINVKVVLNSIVWGLILCSCNKQNFEISNFSPIENFGDKNETVRPLELDYTNALDAGFIIPTFNQTKEGKFVFSFSIKNTDKTKKYYYKIFYQNESYKFPEDSSLANENFYGSWEDVKIAFKETKEIIADGQFHVITDTFRIVGNPRNELQFYGAPRTNEINEQTVNEIKTQIKSKPEWYNSIVQKAKQNKVSIEKQLLDDALYVLKEMPDKTTINQRWKRNPRTGRYSFLLVVTTQENIYNGPIPDYIQNISLRSPDSVFVNPYTYFLTGEGKNISNTYVALSDVKLEVKAKLNLAKGIYIEPRSFHEGEYTKENYSEKCGESEQLKKEACIEQFIHVVDKNYAFENIPIVADVTGGEYSKKDYRNTPYDKTVSAKVPIAVTNCPCKTVGYDEDKKSVFIKNPGTKTGEWRKENVGVITRHGLTYGKYRVKVKLTELLNNDNLWNGLTNAIWLIGQPGAWNTRRPCEKEGYIAKEIQGNKDASRQRVNTYSEIDIEIVKGAHYWPRTSYKGGDRPQEPLSDSSNIMVTATNWDLACPQPVKYDVGVFPIVRDGSEYPLHRWDSWYQAITTKYPASDDELFKSDFYWFEIDWKPTEIIWRMGPDKNKLKEFAYMNETVTSIPNNQMLLVITQEWHNGSWWPEAPFDQNRIPFPSKDILGHIYEMEIE